MLHEKCSLREQFNVHCYEFGSCDWFGSRESPSSLHVYYPNPRELSDAKWPLLTEINEELFILI